jgi:hypothetical protein
MYFVLIASSPVNGDNLPVENDMDGIEQLLDLVHIMILALLQNAVWESDHPRHGEGPFLLGDLNRASSQCRTRCTSAWNFGGNYRVISDAYSDRSLWWHFLCL